MKEIKIGSFNIKDNRINSLGGIRKDGTDNSLIIANFIKREKFDFLGTQELTKKFIDKLKKYLTDYTFNGKYRLNNSIFVNLPFNESNIIITKKSISKSYTVRLPFLPIKLKGYHFNKRALIPRIASVIISDEYKLCLINTHLNLVESIQIRQLEFLKRMIKKMSDKYDVAITGDFNMESNNEVFIDFEKSLKELKIKRVEIDGNTWYSSNGKGKRIDYIFIPESWGIKESGIINNLCLAEITDHRCIYVKALIK